MATILTWPSVAPSGGSLNLKDHAEAHKWEAFLKKVGFETKHHH